MANTTEKVIKVTKKDYFAMLRTIVEEAHPENQEVILGFIDHEVELLNKKASTPKSKKTNEANEALASAIVEILTNEGVGMTVSEMQAKYPEILYKNGEISGQRVTAIVTGLVKAEKLTRTTNKKKAYFAVK